MQTDSKPALQKLETDACLDFPGRDTVKAWEIADKLGYSTQHIFEHIEAGKLVAIDSALVTSRRNIRVPIDEYRRWVMTLLTGPARRTFLAELPPSVLAELRAELAASERSPKAANCAAAATLCHAAANRGLATTCNAVCKGTPKEKRQ